MEDERKRIQNLCEDMDEEMADLDQKMANGLKLPVVLENCKCCKVLFVNLLHPVTPDLIFWLSGKTRIDRSI